MDIFSLLGIGVVGTALVLLIKQYKPEYAVAITVGICVVMLLGVLAFLVPAFNTIKVLTQQLAVGGEYTGILIKCLGICYATQLTADICRDCGENAIASKVELGGKACIIIISLPLFTNLLNIAIGIINI